MDLRAIREAVAERLSTELAGVSVFAFPPDQVPTGASDVIYITNGEGAYVDYQEAFSGGLARVNLTVSIAVPYVDPRSGWARMDALLSSGGEVSGSVVDALEDGTDRTFGGVIDSLAVQTVSNVAVVDTAAGARQMVADLSIVAYSSRRA